MPRRFSEKDLAAASDHVATGAPLGEFKSTPPRKRDNAESRLQQEFFKWWDRVATMEYAIDKRLMHSVPNGALYGFGQERVIRAKILKAEGLRPGYPDVGLDVPRGGYHGLRIEFKLPHTNPDIGQQVYHSLLRAQEYKVAVVRSLEEAKRVVHQYLT